ncbi:MAG: bifunctional proline dehydrogenase/L-glutamate gamma-semialdehyde dehydrogenase PutA [Gammaproteobacteria bacterium]
MLNGTLKRASPSRTTIRGAYRADERTALRPLLEAARLPQAQAANVLAEARLLAQKARTRMQSHGGIEELMQHYDLSSEEGVLLMCLAEALLRIPDTATRQQLIRDKLLRGHWDSHLGQGASMLVNASTWGLILTGRIVTLANEEGSKAPAVLARMTARAGRKVVELALGEALSLLARHFVFGATIEDALHRSRKSKERFSYDCLGEAALSAHDVEIYCNAYRHAIAVIAARHAPRADPLRGPGLSLKLTALHPRFELAQRRRVLAELEPRLLTLVKAARAAGIGVTLDAEEAHQLELTLDLFERVHREPSLAGWDGFGLAVQAYQNRAKPVLEWLAELARVQERRIPVRLVKGAYWDSEIKRAQQLGLDGYPVFTRKSATDVSYLACARYLLEHRDAFYCQFATHNSFAVRYILALAGDPEAIEFQRLHGMGEALYQSLAAEGVASPCRVYAPVGSQAELLPYLVRRLLENGANTSFVNRLADPDTPIDHLVDDPVARLQALDATPHPRIPVPIQLFGPERRNARGVDLSDPLEITALEEALQRAWAHSWHATPIVGGQALTGDERPVADPADRRRIVGRVIEADVEALRRAFTLAAEAQPAWETTPVTVRAAMLEGASDRFEQHQAELVALVVREGGRTIADALAEVREAVDACRYYALLARRELAVAQPLPGPVGEANTLHLRGRGVFACLSPWNFPVAIFTAQVAAGLVAGNAVIAKPAGQTPLCAARVVRLMHAAGVPGEVLHLLPGTPVVLGHALLGDARLAGIAFTGSTETACRLQQSLAARRGPILPLIAETGGQNVLIADSSALPAQLVPDVLTSAFNSAGQRCSALRVLFLQEAITERVLRLLTDAMDELVIGDPADLATDIGPVIDAAACDRLAVHTARLRVEGKLRRALPLPKAMEYGSFFAPHVFEIDSLEQLHREVFGPVLHVIRYPAGGLDRVIDAVNGTGYGLTLGVHSRIESTWERVRQRARVGNLYVNRNMIGAVMGVQPFGGEGLSGTGPKAGGPHYLHRFITERTVTVNTSAVGGNVGLLSLQEEDSSNSCEKERECNQAVRQRCCI